ncbi:hypothetical protein BGZ47_011424 [Haplosporangium gracile]|nr:hypothetical protein BGZ47_011424 [Haplosporangium gracile]
MLSFSCFESLVEFTSSGTIDMDKRGLDMNPKLPIGTLSKVLWSFVENPAPSDNPPASSPGEHYGAGIRAILESISVYKLYDDCPIAEAISRHSETLRMINFPACQYLQSTALQTILLSCRALKILQLQDKRSRANNIALRDTVDTEIRRLEIAAQFTPDGRDPACLADQSMEIWTEQDRNHWKMLDSSYTQIGLLTSLEVLNIKSAGQLPPEAAGGRETQIPFRKSCLPGLLALEDAPTGQFGFLSSAVNLVPRALLDLQVRRPGLALNDFM